MKSSFSILTYAVLYFLIILTIENIFPFIAMHRIFIFQIINLAFGKDEMRWICQISNSKRFFKLHRHLVYIQE